MTGILYQGAATQQQVYQGPWDPPLPVALQASACNGNLMQLGDSVHVQLARKFGCVFLDEAEAHLDIESVGVANARSAHDDKCSSISQLVASKAFLQLGMLFLLLSKVSLQV
jgi:hypothetical protein